MLFVNWESQLELSTKVLNLLMWLGLQTGWHLFSNWEHLKNHHPKICEATNLIEDYPQNWKGDIFPNLCVKAVSGPAHIQGVGEISANS